AGVSTSDLQRNRYRLSRNPRETGRRGTWHLPCGRRLRGRWARHGVQGSATQLCRHADRRISGCRKKYIEFVTRYIQNGPNVDGQRLAILLTAGNADPALK